jgi:exonuclease VII small subunit
MNARTLKLNPLDHPICLAYPGRLASTAWAAHVPFAMFMVDILRPRTIVELGVYSGVSYCAFCQAVKELNLNTRCFGIDTWQGDANSGPYGPEILSDLREYHDPLYENFSSLIQSTFDDALSQFENNTIDLLHIDGFHSYESVKHDFEVWLPKMSSQGVVLFHDINVRDPGFGVWKLWEEIKLRYPHFEFVHEHGLGVIATGTPVPDGLRELLELSEIEAAIIRDFFNQLGQRLRVRMEKDQVIHARDDTISGLETQVSDLKRHVTDLERHVTDLERVVTDLERVVTGKDHQIIELDKGLTERDRHIASLYQTIAKFEAAPLRRAMRVARRGFAKLLSSPRSGSQAP